MKIPILIFPKIVFVFLVTYNVSSLVTHQAGENCIQLLSHSLMKLMVSHT